MLKLRNCAALLAVFALVLALAACGGKTAGNDALHARFSVLYESDALAEMLADPAQHSAEIAAYGLDDFAATFADTDAFRSYTVEISVQNPNDFAVEVLNVQMDTSKQGTNGVWFSALTDNGQIGLPAHFTGDEALYYYAIADASLSMQDVLQTLGGMGVSCVYIEGAEAPDMDEEIDPALLHTSDILYEQ